MAGSSDTEQRIRRLSLAITSLDRQIRKAKDDVASLYQQVMAAASVILRDRQCPVTIDVTVFAHTPLVSLYVPGVSVEVWYPDNTGTKIGSTEITDGVGECTITGEIPSGGVAATVYFSRSPWWADGVNGIALTCGSNTTSWSMQEASGYEATYVCIDPVGDVLTLIDADNGTTTITYNGGGGGPRWFGSLVVGPVTYNYIADFQQTDGTGVHEPGYIKATAVVALVTVGVASTASSTISCGGLDYVGTGTGTVAYWAGGTFDVHVTDP